VDDGFCLMVVLTKFKEDMVSWALRHKSTLHDVGCPQYAQLGNVRCAIFSYDVNHDLSDLSVGMLRLDAIYVPGEVVNLEDKESLLHSSLYIQQHSPCKESGDLSRRGTNKRGPVSMTNVGYNFAACNSGKVSVYQRRKASLSTQVRVWGEAVHYLSTVKQVVSKFIGAFPLQCMVNRAFQHGKEYSSTQSPPVIGNVCTSIHQTLNSEVWPHVDTQDFDFTIISWSQAGDVRGPFLLHAFGVAFEVQVHYICLLTIKNV
jgi:hypothetical protein